MGAPDHDIRLSKSAARAGAASGGGASLSRQLHKTLVLCIQGEHSFVAVVSPRAVVLCL